MRIKYDDINFFSASLRLCGYIRLFRQYQFSKYLE